MTLSILFVVDVRVLNMMKYGKTMGPMRKGALLFAINSPIMWYFGHHATQSYMDMKRHLVTRYLIQDDKILYKK